MDSFLQDLKQGVRALGKQPALTVAAVVALALGIGANTAIFSVVHAVLLEALPYRDANRLVMVWETFQKTGARQNVLSVGNFLDWKTQNTVFEDMAVFLDQTVNLTGDGEPEEIPAQVATANLFSILGVNPFAGRLFVPEDGKPGAPRSVVLGYGLWQRRFGGDPAIVGRAISLNNSPAIVLGVLPPEFGWHVRSGSTTGKPAEVWAAWPLEAQRNLRGRFAMAVARLRDGVSVSQAQAEMNVIAGRLEKENAEFNTGWGVNLVPLREQFSGEIRLALFVLLGAVACVLLIACANVANLLLARASVRQREVATRAALGASRTRLVRQLLTESLVLAGVGGAAGLVLAWWGTDLLVGLGPPELQGVARASISVPVLLFTTAVSMLTGILFGLAPAFETTRASLTESLKEGGRSATGAARTHRLRHALVVAEFAMAFVLLAGAGLLIRSLARLEGVDPGFHPENVLTMRVSLPWRVYDTDAKRIDFFREALARLQAIPGVAAAGAINFIPFGASRSVTVMEIEGRPKRPPGQELDTGVVVTDAGFFRAMQLPLVRGRLFTDQETREMRHVVVVNETLARQYFPGEDVLGKRLTIEMKEVNEPCEVIGVVADMKHQGLDVEAAPMSYWPLPELAPTSMTLIVRTTGETAAASVASSVRTIVQGLDPKLPVADVAMMESVIGKSMARSRFNTFLLTIFAGVAMLLAAVGIYGVMAYAVAQRTHEIGIRMALGAPAAHVLRLVVSRGMAMAAAGAALGLVGSFAMTRWMRSMLFQVSATDPLTFMAVPLLLGMIALLACAIPARRAARVDPMVALRNE